MRYRILIIVELLCGLLATPNVRAGDETGRYFENLRRRGLFAIAEHYALSRLSDPQLPPVLKTELTAELSSTFAAHAAVVSPQQREELWSKARDILEDALKPGSEVPRAELLRSQRGLVAARRAEVLWWDASVAPKDPVASDRALRSAEEAAALLTQQMTRLEAQLKPTGRRSADSLAPQEIRQLLPGLQSELGNVQRRRAALLPVGSPDRASALVDAQAAYRETLSEANDRRRIALAKLGLADLARLQRDFVRAREMCAAIAGTQPLLDLDLLQAVEACRLRCILDEDQPLAAAEAFLVLRRTEPVMSGELWLIQMQTLLALRTMAEQKSDQDLMARLDAEMDLVIQRIDEQAGGSWSLWCRRLRDGAQSRRQYGESLDRLVTRARAEYQAGHHTAAEPLLSEAFVAARQQHQRELAVELGTLHGTVLLELNQFENAAATLSAVVDTMPAHPHAAATDLLAAYALGRAYEQQRTQLRRMAYTTALERHLERYHDGPTVGDALFMLAQLEEQRLQFSQALPLYLRIAPDHLRYHAGTAGAARCQIQIVLRLKQLKQDWSAFHAQAVTELKHRTEAWDKTLWSTAQGETALQLIRLELWSVPPDCRAAAVTLDRFDAAAVAVSEGQEAWQPLRQQAVPLKLVAWAGTGRSQLARQLLAAAPLQQPADLWAVVSGLDQLAAGSPDGQFVDLTELLVDAVQRLEPQREHLPADLRLQFDLARIRAYLVTGRVMPALSVAQEYPADVSSQRALATLLMTSRDPAALAAARTSWQKIEAQTPAGSPDWLSSRLQAIEIQIALGERAEAAKLLKITRLLYPQTDSLLWQQRYSNLEQQLR